MPVRRYGSAALARREAERELFLGEMAAAIRSLLALAPPPPRRWYPADERWNTRRRVQRYNHRRHWWQHSRKPIPLPAPFIDT
jgi:hypothetical protein